MGLELILEFVFIFSQCLVCLLFLQRSPALQQQNYEESVLQTPVANLCTCNSQGQ